MDSTLLSFWLILSAPPRNAGNEDNLMSHKTIIRKVDNTPKIVYIFSLVRELLSPMVF